MRTLASILTVLVPLAAYAQTLPAKPFQPPQMELELVYLLVSGNIASHRPGDEKMTVQLAGGPAGPGLTGTIEISKAAHCRYLIVKHMVIRGSKPQPDTYRGWEVYDFSKPVTATIKKADGNWHAVTFSGFAGIVALTGYFGVLINGLRENEAGFSETEADWELDLGPEAGTVVSPDDYRIAGEAFAKSFCKDFKVVVP